MNGQTVIKRVPNYIKAIHEHLNSIFHHVREYQHYKSLKSGGSITQFEWYSFERKSPIESSKGHLFFDFE